MQRKNSCLARCLVVGGLLVACSKPAPERFNTISIAALNDGAVVVIALERPRVFALRGLDHSGARSWQATVDCSSEPIVTTAADRIFAHCLAGGSGSNLQRISAFAASDGRPLWKHDEKASRVASTRRLTVVGDSVIAGGDDRALVLSANDGSLRLLYPSDQALRIPVVDGTTVAFLGLRPMVVIDTKSGKGATAEFVGSACVAGGKLWVVHDNQLSTRPLADLAAPAVVVELGMNGGSPIWIDACGVYADSPVLQLQVASKTEMSLRIVRLDAQNSVTWELNLGNGDTGHTALWWERSDAAGLNGDLPRFAILALHHYDTSTLMLIDLQAGTTKPISGPISDHDIVTVSVFRDRDEWFIDDRAHLSAYLATTGELRGQREAPFYPLTPGAVGPAQVWVSSQADVGFSALGRDLRDGTPVGTPRPK